MSAGALGGDEPGTRARWRIAELSRAAGALRDRVDGWFADRRGRPEFRRFTAHFDTLHGLLGRMLDRLDGYIGDLGAVADDRAVYAAGRKADNTLLTIARTFEWYREKYDQRRSDLGDLLAAADEVARSCWEESFDPARPRPTGPFTYLEPRLHACANLRSAVPPDLRAEDDAVVADLIATLPIPTVALPERTRDAAWWLVVIAHETGHHVQHDLGPGLPDRTRQRLRARVAGAEPELADDWGRWSAEVFADAFAAWMVGPAGGWAVDELEFGPLEIIGAPEDTDRYPPAMVRLALYGELVHRAGLGNWPADAAGLARWLDALPPGAMHPGARAAIGRHLRLVPLVADALAEIPCAGGTLGDLRDRAVHALRPGARLAEWSDRLRRPDPRLFPLNAREAARVAVAAGVHAYSDRADERGLHRSLVDTLCRSGAAGRLAGGAPAGTDRVAAIADEFMARLLGPVVAA